MDARETQRNLGEAEVELKRIERSMAERLRRDARLRHDLANAMMLVIVFRELLDGGFDDGLIVDANEAAQRALEIAAALH